MKIAVVTGRHPFDVPGFHQVFRSFPEVDHYIQHLDDFVKAPKDVREAYDAVVFYNMHMGTPGDEKDWWETGVKEALEQLGETDQGIVVLHHAILAFPEWQTWSDIVGIADRSFGYYIGETVESQIADPEHPITRGLKPWTMIDETYEMADAGEGSHVLITYDHPKSMKTIAWTREYRNSRVFCYEAGHDNQTYVEPSFREVLRRGILWSAGRI